MLQNFSGLALQVFKYVDAVLSLTPNVSKMISHSGYLILEEIFETSKPFTFMIFSNQLEGTRCALSRNFLASKNVNQNNLEDVSDSPTTPRNENNNQNNNNQSLNSSSFVSVLSSSSITSLTRHIIRSIAIIDVIKNTKLTTKTCFMAEFMANPPLQRILLEETFREMSGRHRIENLDATDVAVVMKNLEILLLCIEDLGYVVSSASNQVTNSSSSSSLLVLFPSSLGLEIIRCIDSIAAESTPAIRSKLMKTKVIDLRNRLAFYLLAASDASPMNVGANNNNNSFSGSTSTSTNATPMKPSKRNNNGDDDDGNTNNESTSSSTNQSFLEPHLIIVSEEEEKNREQRMLAVVQACRTEPNATLLLFKFILDAVKAQNAEQLSVSLSLLRALYSSEIEQRNAMAKIIGSAEHLDILIKTHRVDSASGQMIPNHFGAWVRENPQVWETQLSKKLSKAVKPVESEVKARLERKEKESQTRQKQLLQEKEKKMNHYNKTTTSAAKVIRDVEIKTTTAMEATFTRIQNERVDRFEKYAEYEMSTQ